MGGEAYWIPEGGGGVTEGVKIFTYVGDDANNREIDLGDDYQEIVVRRQTSIGAPGFVIQAWSVGTNYGLFSSSNNLIGSNANVFYQGKMTGVDANKILLGTAGSNSGGVNQSTITYQVTAFKYSVVTP